VTKKKTIKLSVFARLCKIMKLPWIAGSITNLSRQVDLTKNQLYKLASLA